MKHAIAWVKKNKKWIILAAIVLLALLTAVVIYNTKIYAAAVNTFGSDDAGIVSYYWGLAGFTVVMTGVICYFGFIRRCKLYIMTALAAVMTGVLFSFVMTPNSIPDEIVHYQTAYRYSNDMMGWGHSTESGGILMNEADSVMHGSYPYIPDPATYNRISNELFSGNSNDAAVEIQGGNASNYPILYLFSGAGITLGRLLSASPIGVYYFGRIFNLAFYVILAALAVRKMPFGKIIPAIVALLPIAMQQAASVSYDPVVNGLALLFTAYCLFIAYGKEKPKWHDWAVMAAALILLAPGKGAYLPLAGLCLLIPAQKFGNMKNKIISIAVLSAVVAVLWCLINIQHFSLVAPVEGDNTATENYNISYLLENPGDALYLFVNTLRTQFNYYLQSMTANYFGWLNIMLPTIISTIYLMLAILATVKPHNEPVYFKRGHRVWMLVIALLSVAASHVIMLFAWTPIGTPIILGIQGRYFLPCLPLFLFFLRNSAIGFKRDYSKYMLMIAASMGVFTAASIFCTLI